MTELHFPIREVLPASTRERLLRHWETVKFLVVGGACFLITIAITYGLKLTVLATMPVAALVVATIIATVVSYQLNREWAFCTRGGRDRHHEAALFFAISGLSIVINAVPMWFAHYALHLQVPYVSRPVQELSDFASGIVLGTLIAMAFRLWALKRWAFPQRVARR